MGNALPASLERVIQELGKFPGIGRKTAQRMGFYLLDAEQQSIVALADALKGLKEKIHACPRCHYISERELCEICSDPRRDARTLCVVERVLDVIIFERMGEYRGLYHVLGGLISPLDGVSPEDLNIADLIARLPEFSEVIIATHASMEGDTTALYVAREAADLPVNITRLARGLPMGTSLEFADEATIANAYNSRVEL